MFYLDGIILVVPINIISRSTSFLKFSNAFDTPFSPPAAKAYKYNLPPEQAFAPLERAFKICDPLLIPPSQIISIFPPTSV